eukprot:521615-Karenia_brevis.AAC.1
MRSLRRWVEISAFVPGIMFAYLWELFLARLRDLGASFLADYVEQHTLERDGNGLYTARWRSD